jgi:hypothetical protein
MESLTAAPVAGVTRRRYALLTLEAVAALGRSRLALSLLSWRQAMTTGGGTAADNVSCSPAAPTVPLCTLESAVRRASRVVPGATCLAQALALRRLLFRYGHASTVHIGVTTADGLFSAHAWVESEGMALLCAAAERERYAPLLTWPPPSSTGS